MEFLVELRYPGGRSHLTTLAGVRDLAPGSEFSLHGRRWRGVAPDLRRRSRSDESPLRLVCVPTD
jgi:hypothetical protein